MTIAFISDIHLTPKRPQTTRLFEQFIANSNRCLTQLYILGDLFEYWVGDDGAEKLGYQEIERALGRTTAAGTEIFFLHGNRDFLVSDQFSNRTGCQLLPDPVVICPDQRPILLTHGDALCTDDVEHQESRKQMLTSKWKMAFLKKPLKERVDTADNMRQQSEQHKAEKSMEIMDVNQQAVEKLMRKHNVEVMIHGHTHRPAVHEFALDEKLARRYVLGDWFEQKSAIFYADEKLTLRL